MAKTIKSVVKKVVSKVSPKAPVVRKPRVSSKPVEPVAGATIPSAPVTKAPVFFEGAQVTAILGYGSNETHFHCSLSDGTTKHVPKELFK